MADAATEDQPHDAGSQPVFLPLILAAVLVLVGIYMVIYIGSVGARFKPALNRTDPALAEQATALGPAQRRLARRVVVVIIDGLRLRDSYGLPYLDSLRRRGVDASATSHYPSFSRPNHVTIVTGVPPAASGVRTNDYKTAVALDSLMDRAAQAGMRSGFAADYSDGLPLLFTRPLAHSNEPIHTSHPINSTQQRREDPRQPRSYKSAFFDATMTTWPGGLELAITRMLADSDYQVVVLIPGAVDEAGHEFGGDSPEYRDAAETVDHMLERALRTLDLTSDAVIITADHGHTDAGGHGGVEPVVMEVPLIMAGAGVRKAAAVTNAQLTDIAPTAAALLGLPAPRHGLGRVLSEALTLDARERQDIAHADQVRMEENQRHVAAWHDNARKQVAISRLWRLPLVCIFAMFGALLFFLARRVHALRIDWRVLVIALPAFPVSYYALLAVFGQQFSPSFVPDRGDLIAVLFRFGLASTAAHVIVSWFAFRGRVVLAERLATANGLFVCGLASSVTTLGLLWAIWPGPFIEVPSPSLVVLIPATYVACACYGLAMAVTLGLELVIFFARAVDPRVLSASLRKKRSLPRTGPV